FFRKQKTWKKLEYQMILLRVFFDALTSITSGIYFLSSMFTLSYSEVIPFDVSFMIGLISSSLIEMRSYLAVVIAIERSCATIFPIHFFCYRKKLSNILIVGFIISTGVALCVVMFWYCELQLPLKEGCTNFNCAAPKCYQDYHVVSKTIYSFLNALFSGILCIKLVCLSCAHSNIQKDIRRTNLLSLTDGLSTLTFELLPAMLFTKGIVDFNVSFSMPYFVVSIFTLYSEVISFDVTFLVGLVSIIIIEMRNYLAVIIAIERVLATTCPIKFWRYRKHFIANISIFCFVILTGLAVPFMMFWICDLKFPIPVGCTSFSCASPKCYQVNGTSAMTFSSSNATFSGILCLKLSCLSIKHTNLSNDLRRANLLSLTDGFSSIVFEFIPALLFKWKIVELNGIGPVLCVLRQIGSVVEMTVMAKLME
ncbi:LOW QUALITY PROTEIN: Protein CBG21846, partial [Caenorhabditis briggsae]